MRKFVTWALAAAFWGIPAVGWCHQADSKAGQQDQAQTSGQSSATTSTTQSPTPQQDSIAEAARKAREAKKDAPKPTKVFDNDNIPGSGGISTVGAEKETKEADASAKDAGAAPNNEKAWREKFAVLRAKLARDQADLEVMQREVGVDNVQFNNGDPVKAMQQELTRDDINKKVGEVDAKTQAVKADQQAIDDAEEELRKSGGEAGWAR